MKSTRDKNRERWRELVSEAENHSEGLAAYCRENNISKGSLYQWRYKFRSQALLLPSSSFVRAEVIHQARGLPDAKWLAEFVMHLSGTRL